MSGAELFPHHPHLAAEHDRLIGIALRPERCNAYLELITSTARPSRDLVRCLDDHRVGHEHHHGITLDGDQVRWSTAGGQLRYTGTSRPADFATAIVVHDPAPGGVT